MIKNIIFDFGGVIYDIDHNKTKEAFSELGISNFDNLFGHAIQTSLFEDFECGLLSPNKFRMAIKEYVPTATDQQIDQAWNALLIGYNTTLFNVLSKAKTHYRLFLLSNTNQIHYLAYMEELKDLNLYKEFYSLFDKLYFSHQIGLRKPNPEIFQYVLSENTLKAEETAFIDDYDVNILAANTIGLNGIHLKPGVKLNGLFTDEGILLSP